MFKVRSIPGRLVMHEAKMAGGVRAFIGYKLTPDFLRVEKIDDIVEVEESNYYRKAIANGDLELIDEVSDHE